MKLNILEPLKKKKFSILIASQLANNLGMFLDYIAITSLLIYKWNETALVLSIFSIFFAFPLIISPFIAVLVNKWKLKNVMVFSSVAVCLITLSLIFVPNAILLIIIIFFRATAKIFYFPAEQTVIKIIFENEDVTNALCLSGIISEIFSIIGPILGGILLLFVKTNGIFVITSILYFSSSIILLFLPNAYNSIFLNKQQTSLNIKNIVVEIFCTFRVFLQKSELLYSYIALGLTTFAFFLVQSMITLLAKDLGFDEHNFQWVMVALGIGAIAGAVYIGEKKNKKDPLGTILAGIIMIGLSLFMGSAIAPICCNHRKIIFLISWIFLGFSMSYATIPYSAMVLNELPKDMIGKATSLSMMTTGIFLIIAPLFGAVLTLHFNIYIPFIFSSLLILGIGITMIIINRKARKNSDIIVL